MQPVCPICDVALVVLEFSGIDLDYCPVCSGIWADSGELQEVLVRTGATVASDPTAAFVPVQESTRKPRMCPRCDRDLQETMPPMPQVMDLRIDRCPAGDGIWFDKNELPQLLDAMPPESNAAAAADLLRDILGIDPGNEANLNKAIFIIQSHQIGARRS